MCLGPFGASAPLFLRNGELLGHSPIRISPWRDLRACVIKFKESQYYETNIFLFFSFTLTTEKKKTNKKNPQKTNKKPD
jgi:hypothetical protein